MKKRGLGFLEMLAMEMKASGKSDFALKTNLLPGSKTVLDLKLNLGEA
jgi:hypothetical protein